MSSDKKIQIAIKLSKYLLGRIIGRRTPLVAGFFLTKEDNIILNKNHGNDIRNSYYKLAKETKKSKISLEEFKKIFDDIQPYVIYLYVDAINPFLIQHLPKYLEYAKKKNTNYIHILSNYSALLSGLRLNQFEKYADEVSFDFTRMFIENENLTKFNTSFETLLANITDIKKNTNLKISINAILILKHVDYYYKLIDSTKKNKCYINFIDPYNPKKYKFSSKSRKFMEYLKIQKHISIKTGYNVPEYAVEFSPTGGITPNLRYTSGEAIPLTKGTVHTMNSYRYNLVLKKLKKYEFIRDPSNIYKIGYNNFFSLSKFIRSVLLR